MKKKIFTLVLSLFIVLVSFAQEYEYKVITSVESIVPGGIGRSRIISVNDTRNYKEYTTTRSDEIGRAYV